MRWINVIVVAVVFALAAPVFSPVLACAAARESDPQAPRGEDPNAPRVEFDF